MHKCLPSEWAHRTIRNTRHERSISGVSWTTRYCGDNDSDGKYTRVPILTTVVDGSTICDPAALYPTRHPEMIIFITTIFDPDMSLSCRVISPPVTPTLPTHFPSIFKSSTIATNNPPPTAPTSPETMPNARKAVLPNKYVEGTASPPHKRIIS
jgi:hypothetical protein